MHIPTQCPTCWAPVEERSDGDGEFLLCSERDDGCAAVKINQLIHYAKTIGMKGFGPAVLEKLYGDRFARYRAAVPALWPRLRAWADPDGNYTATSGGKWDLDRYSDNNELGTLLAVLAGVVVFWLRGAVAE